MYTDRICMYNILAKFIIAFEYLPELVLGESAEDLRVPQLYLVPADP